jgi:hypothetical protein
MIRSIGWLKRTEVTDWKSHLDALVEESRALTVGVPAKTPLPSIIDQPSLPSSIRPTGSLREEIAQ